MADFASQFGITTPSASQGQSNFTSQFGITHPVSSPQPQVQSYPPESIVNNPASPYQPPVQSQNNGLAGDIAKAHIPILSGIGQFLVDVKNAVMPTLTAPQGKIENTINDFKDSFSSAWQDYVTKENKAYTTIHDPNAPISAKVGSFLENAAAGVNVVFSPLTAFFHAANDVPLLSNLAKGLLVYPAVLGATGEVAAKDVVNAIPTSVMPQNVKDNLIPGIKDITSLAFQFGGLHKAGEIGMDKIKELSRKYSPQDVQTIVKQAQGLAEDIKANNPDVTQQAPHPLVQALYDLRNTKSPDDAILNPIIDEAGAIIKSDENYKTISEQTDKATQEPTAQREANQTVNPITEQVKPISETGQPQGSEVRPNIERPTGGQPEGAKPATAETTESNGSVSRGNEPGTGNTTGNGEGLEPITDVTNNQYYRDYIKSRDELLAKKNELYSQGYKTDADLPPKELKTLNTLRQNFDSKYLTWEKAAKEFLSPTKILRDKYTGKVISSLKEESPQGKENRALQEGTSTTEKSQTGLKVSKIAKEIDAKAVEAKLTEGFSKLAGYEPVTIKDQAARATDLLNNHFDTARAIIRGEEDLPKGLKGTSLITAMEEHLKDNPSGELAQELAKSPLVSGTSQAAQELRLAAERDPYSAVNVIRQLENDRRAVIEKKAGTTVEKATEKTIKDIKDTVNKTAPDKAQWASFVKSIQC